MTWMKTALTISSQNGHTDIVIELLKHDEVDVNLYAFDETALRLASRNGHTDIVVQLLQHNDLDVNLQVRNFHQTALWWASHYGHTNIVVELLKHDEVDVNLQDDDGTTALWQASVNGHKEIVLELLKHNKKCTSVAPAVTLDDCNHKFIDAAGKGRLHDVQNLLQKGQTSMPPMTWMRQR
jgi:serine/threonine-protein phosphatase 6 regulatory ankyrin repeat subunit B